MVVVVVVRGFRLEPEKRRAGVGLKAGVEWKRSERTDGMG